MIESRIRQKMDLNTYYQTRKSGNLTNYLRNYDKTIWKEKKRVFNHGNSALK